MLVGNRVKLHPVWIIFALTAGGALFGFTGVLLAVPVAAVVGVLVRFALRQYLDSNFYDNRAASLPVVDPSEL
jgi:predicted PurR-regulated permease PerM